MKRFIIKVATYTGILLVIIFITVFYCLRYRTPKGFLFLSNSISYNLKAGFIEQHPEKLANSKIVVVGSSMSLDNVNAKLLQDSFHLPAVNLSSWGLRLSCIEKSPIWDQPKVFVHNLGVTDFGPHGVKLLDDFSFRKKSQWQKAYDICTNFSTYQTEISQAKKIMMVKDTRDYSTCHFDECGSIQFSDSAFKYDSVKWNDDNYARFGLDSTTLMEYVQDLKRLTSGHKGYERFIVSFSPGRRIFYRPERYAMIAYLGRLIREHCPGVVFFNLYDHEYADSEFADASHLNVKGSARFTGELIDSIRRAGVL